MSLYHAVVWTDHRSAQVVQFDADQVQSRKVQQHRHNTAQHGSEVRDAHEFMAEICDSLEGVGEVIITGPHTALSDFRHFVEKHRPKTAGRIVAYEAVDHPTEPQLVALARKHFLRHDRMTGSAPLN